MQGMESAVPFELPSGSPPVVVKTSTRRRKTSMAQWVDGHIVVSLPAHLKGDDRQKTIEWLVEKLLAKEKGVRSLGDAELMAQARQLSERYLGGVKAASVRWVTNQSSRWGSCTVSTREIRISHRLREVPDWVLDSVLVHELAHLVHANHSRAFHQLADRYPRHGDASIFLAGFGIGLNCRLREVGGVDPLEPADAMAAPVNELPRASSDTEAGPTGPPHISGGVTPTLW
jgi:hypothetical protein